MASRSAIARQLPSTSSVRRNLFHQQSSSRRTATASSVDSLQITSEDATARDDEIIVKDDGGSYNSRLSLEQLLVGEEDEMQEGEQKIDANLILMYRNHSRQHIDGAELKAAVQASLREKVSSLDEDRWMYEREDDDESQN